MRPYLTALVVATPALALAALPLQVSHEGYLLDSNDQAVTNPALSMSYSIWDDVASPDASHRVWPATENTCVVKVQNGYYAVVLGSACAPGLTSDHITPNAPRWIEIAVAGSTLAPRIPLTPSPAATVASLALAMPDAAVTNQMLANPSLTLTAGAGLTGGGSVMLGAATTLALAPVGTAGSFTNANVTVDEYGRITAATNGAAQGVTSITAGVGLTGGTINTSGTVAVDVGTTAGKIVQLDSGGKIPGVSVPSLAGDVTGPVGATRVEKLGGIALPSGSPGPGQVLSFDGTSWTYSGLSGAFLLNGNTFGAAATLGTNDAQNLNFETANTVRVTVTGAGSVGVGTTTPTASVETTGGLRVGNDIGACDASRSGTIKFNLGDMWVCDGTGWKVVSLLSPTANVILTGGAGSNMNVLGPGSPAYGTPVAFTYQNIGGASTVSMTTALTNSTNFEITADTCNGTVLPRNGTCTVTVRPKASANASLTGTLNLNW